MPTMKRPPLGQECIEARIVLRVAQLRELAGWTACEYWRQRKGGDPHGGASEIDIPPGHLALRQERQHRDRGAASAP